MLKLQSVSISIEFRIYRIFALNGRGNTRDIGRKLSTSLCWEVLIFSKVVRNQCASYTLLLISDLPVLVDFLSVLGKANTYSIESNFLVELIVQFLLHHSYYAFVKNVTISGIIWCWGTWLDDMRMAWSKKISWISLDKTWIRNWLRDLTPNCLTLLILYFIKNVTFDQRVERLIYKGRAYALIVDHRYTIITIQQALLMEAFLTANATPPALPITQDVTDW